MNSILMAVQPKWCELIAQGKKTVEVRKTRPKIDTPFKCYIYATKGAYRDIGKSIPKEPLFRIRREDGSLDISQSIRKEIILKSTWQLCNGEVIGEFVCDKISYLGNIATDKWKFLTGNIHDYHKRLITYEAGLTEQECLAYGGKYAWHISDLKIYDKPKDLSEFTSIWTDAGMKCKHKEQRQMVSTGERYFHCFSQNCICEFLKLGRQTDCEGYEPTKEPAALEKPPQSWCYVEEVR